MLRKHMLNNNIKDALTYAALEEQVVDSHYKHVNKMTGKNYEKLTTFYGDLSIAEWYGKESIIDTYNTVVESWFDNVKFFTEFVMCLNLKCWEHYGDAEADDTNESQELSELYASLFYKAKDLVYDKWTGDDIDYFFDITD